MYECSEYVQNLFKKHYRQVARITITPLSGDPITVTEKDIPQGGLTIDRYCQPTRICQAGSVIAAQLDLKLRNTDGKFNSFDFEGAEIFVEIGVKKWDARNWEHATIHYIPCGVFVVNQRVRPLSLIEITALDRMVKLDEKATFDNVEFPITIGDMITHICDSVNISTSSNSDHIYRRNMTVEIPDISNIDMTWRELLSFCVAFLGCGAYFDYNGELIIVFFSKFTLSEPYPNTHRGEYKEPCITITPSDRYFSDIDEKDRLFLMFSYGERAHRIAGSGALIINYAVIPESKQGDALISEYVSEHGSATGLFNGAAENGLMMSPMYSFTATIKSAPYLFPFDYIKLVKNGNEYLTFVTNVTIRLNGNTKIACNIETVEEAGLVNY